MNILELYNQTWFLFLNASEHPSSWLLKLSYFLAHTLSFFIPVILTLLWFYGGRKQREAVLMVYLNVLLSMGFNLVITHLWFHPRPFMIGLGTNFMKHSADTSFPSDHMTTACAVAWTFILTRQARLACLFSMVALSVGWARMYLGVHFPFDILGSVFVALFGAWIIKSLWPRFGDGLMVWAEKLYRHLMSLPIR